VKRAFNWADQQGALSPNPLRNVQKPPATRRTRIVSQAEREEILAAVKDRNFREFLFALDQTGYVRQEVFQTVARGIAGFRRDRPGDSFRGWLYTSTRSRLLDHYVQADALRQHDPLFDRPPRPTEVGCWAHARRKFHDARTSDPFSRGAGPHPPAVRHRGRDQVARRCRAEADRRPVAGGSA
jgi:Transposase IS66 family